MANQMNKINPEFNEFLQLMSKQQKSEHTREDLMSAFRIFDDDDDGCIHAGDLGKYPFNLDPLPPPPDICRGKLNLTFP